MKIYWETEHTRLAFAAALTRVGKVRGPDKGPLAEEGGVVGLQVFSLKAKDSDGKMQGSVGVV